MARPIIGSRYAPQRFETRTSDGTYRCLRPTQGVYGEALQAGLLNKEQTRTTRAALVTAAIVAAAVAAAVLLTN